MRAFLMAAMATLMLTACVSNSGPGPKGTTGFDPAQLAKTDIDRVADAHRREVFTSLRLLADKLYRRNPREWRKSGATSVEAAIGRLFEPRYVWRLPEFQGKWGTDAVLLAFREEYAGDRVAAFIGGLGGMLHAAFEERSEFFVTDDLDPQKLYNSARNVEIAIWKLGQARNAEGTLILLSNEMNPSYNLSFEREFGKMIGNLDLLAKLVADKSHRTIAKTIQSVATAVFLPVPGLK
ncbi:MAG: hypothetical protein OEL88_06740 [Sterolibacteriaceae bacterium MAG5]|nr:hypothetical protein [Candidatus Nitricoxidireducens bremensis]